MIAGSYFPYALAPAAGLQYSVVNREFLFEADNLSTLSIASDGTVVEWREATGNATYRFYQDFGNPSFTVAARRGRNMLYNATAAAITANEEAADSLKNIGGNQTLFWVWVPPVTAPSGENPMWAGYTYGGAENQHRFVLLASGQPQLYRTDEYGNIFHVRWNLPAGWVWDPNTVYSFVLRYSSTVLVDLRVNGTLFDATYNTGNSTMSAGGTYTAYFDYFELFYQQSVAYAQAYGRGLLGAFAKYSARITDTEAANLALVKNARYPA